MQKHLLVFLLVFFSLKSTSQKTIVNTPIDSGTKKAERHLELLQEHYANGDYDLHKAYSDSLLLVSKKYGLTKMQILALNNQAVYYNSRSERQLALKRYHTALQLCENIPEDYRSKAIVLVNMGNTYRNIGAYDKTILTMEQVVTIADNFKDSDKIKVAALTGLSNSYIELKNYEQSLEYALQAKQISEKIKNDRLITIALNNISDNYIQLKLYQKALENTTVTLQNPYALKPTKSRAWLLLHRGIAYLKLENYTESEKNLLDCQTLSKEKNLLEIEMYANEYLALAYEKQNDFKASYNAQKEYSRLKEALENDTKNATKTDVDNNIAKQNKIIAAKDSEVNSLGKNRKQIILWSGGLLLVLSTLLFLLMKRKKTAELESAKLQAQYKNLLVTISNSENQQKIFNSKTTEQVSKTIAPYQNSSLTETDRALYKKQILDFMANDKPFLNPDLNQVDLAKKLGISSNHLSEVLYYGFEQNFYNFINSYRIVEAQKLIKEPAYMEAKIMAVAFDSGFKSKTSFNRVFKKYTGFTPSEYKNS